MRSPLLLAVIVISFVGACGLTPGDPFTGKRIGDGIAPWTDLGPVQLCLGSNFLGPPDTTPGGFCVSRANALCTSDRDCRSRESCVCGQCTVGYCSAASDCAGGRICTFAENRCDVACADAYDCARDEECFNGTCRGRCLNDDECQSGEVCNSLNYCITVDCASDASCDSGEACTIQRVPRQALEPSALASGEASTVVLWIELADEGQTARRRIWRAESRDGRLFRIDPARPVLDDGLDNRAPSVVRTPDGYALYYEWNDGAEIRVATSRDGTDFADPVTALVGGAGPGAVRAPSAVVLPDGSVAVYYQVGDGAAIGLATGPLGGALTARGGVLTPADITVPPSGRAAPFWDPVEAIRSPHALVTDGADGPSLRLWFSAFGHESADSYQFGQVLPIPANHSVGYAQGSVDAPDRLVPWPYGPVADRVDAFLDHREELTPGVVRLDGDDAYLLYYVDGTPAMGAMGAAGPFVIGRVGVMGNGAYEATTGP